MHRFRQAGLAVLVTTGLALTACSSGGASAGGGDADSITLQTIWTSGNSQGTALRDAIKEFTAESGIKVKILENGEDLNQVYETSLLAGDEADVLLVGLLEKQLDWAKNGAVIPVNNYLKDWDLGDAIPKAAVEAWTDDEDNVRGFPYTGFTWPWWYNTDLLKKAGTEVPKTIDELKATATALRASGVGPVATGGNDWSGQKIFLQILQTYMDEKETIQVFEKGGLCKSPNAMKGVELFAELRDAGVFVDGVEGLTADQAQALYMSGKAAIGPMGSWAYLHAEEPVASATELGGFPVASGGTFTKPNAYRGDTSAGWWVTPNGQKKEASLKKLVEFMYKPSTIQIMADAGIVMATSTKVDTSHIDSPIIAQANGPLLDSVDWAVMPDGHVPGDVSNPMYRATSVAYTKGNDAKAICAAVDNVYAAAG
ncbi:ABC transporter substrate-binding protein [Mycetocola sp. JXN-3]|uniref:ABC transporter substrate-binding protein n=1 Tax=Mycetocola sp. JXN-3 TaxID=2116510 RepID=UPI00165D2903|nr:extracellular solute-binding protein [Mycetocola sp. JXN-3]